MFNSKLKTQNSKLTVRVPATSANLGPGFDVLGLALDLHNEFTISTAETTHIEIEGHGEDMPRDETNLFYRAFAHLYRVEGQTPPPLHIQMRLAVPPGRGLGSSATAVVGGLVAANTLMGWEMSEMFMAVPFTYQELLSYAVQLEQGQHADNVAPALLGGLVVNTLDGDEVISAPMPFPDDLKAVLFIPDFEMDTVQGRALMPPHYNRSDVVYNTSRVALFLSAITQHRYDLLRVAMEDRMHQPYRAQIFPLMPTLIQAALDAGAHGACLSGGGSSILALATRRHEEIAKAMRSTAKSAGVAGHAIALDISADGAQVITEDEV